MTAECSVELKAGLDQGSLWCEEPPTVAGSGFVPVTEIRLVTSCLDGSGKKWQSQNGYLVSARTTFDTGATAAVGDDYYGIAAEGPIYSLRCLDGPGQEFVLPQDGCLNLEFQLFDGSKEVWSGEARRVTRRDSEEATGETVAFLHTETLGARHGTDMLAAQGYEVLDIAIQPESPVLDLVLEQLSDAGPLHLVSSGRASEAALELAQRLPNLKSVVTFSGSGLRFSPWSIGGEELPYVQCDHSSLQPRGGSVLFARKVYAEAVADRENRDRGRIAVEKIECPLYMFTGADDQMWPSSAFSELAAQRRKAHGLEEQTFHRTFPSVGHDLGPELGLPGLPTTERTIAHPSTGFRLALGGKMGRQSRARRACWEGLLAVLRGEQPTPDRE